MSRGMRWAALAKGSGVSGGSAAGRPINCQKRLLASCPIHPGHDVHPFLLVQLLVGSSSTRCSARRTSTASRSAQSRSTWARTRLGTSATARRCPGVARCWAGSVRVGPTAAPISAALPRRPAPGSAGLAFPLVVGRPPAPQTPRFTAVGACWCVWQGEAQQEDRPHDARRLSGGPRISGALLPAAAALCSYGVQPDSTHPTMPLKPALPLAAPQLCSKRAFEGQVKKWRRQLHVWDPPEVRPAQTLSAAPPPLT